MGTILKTRRKINRNCTTASNKLPVSESWSFILALTLSAGVCLQEKNHFIIYLTINIKNVKGKKKKTKKKEKNN